jgi:hypothetical protein
MTTKNGDLPAFPAVLEELIRKRGNETHYGDVKYAGLTKREQFAMAAMQGLCADIVSVYENLCGDGTVPTEYVAKQAANMADALLAELESKK